MALRLEVAAAASFDGRVARRLDRGAGAVTVVHAYQGAARRTLRSAARCGALGVLEVTSLHHHARGAGGFDQIYPTRLLDRVEDGVTAELAEADVLVVPSEHVAAAVRHRCGAGARIVVAPYGVDLGFESSAPDVSGPPVERHGLVLVSSVSSLKGLWVLVQALDLLADEGHPTVDVRVLGPGGREPGLDRALREHPWIEVRGQVDRESVRRAMAGARALVFPSLGDSFGRVQVEALACGTPVLASDACGAVVTEGCGAVHPAGDAARLAADIKALLDGSLPTSEDACRGRARAFTWEGFVESLADAYARVPS
ncbi:MAG: glycosyltransferase family 4 protein [Actinomycetes bacterium]